MAEIDVVVALSDIVALLGAERRGRQRRQRWRGIGRSCTRGLVELDGGQAGLGGGQYGFDILRRCVARRVTFEHRTEHRRRPRLLWDLKAVGGNGGGSG